MFKEMSDKEFDDAKVEAENALWSPYASFARQLVGYSITRNGSSIPKWLIWVTYKDSPHQLELIIDGKHSKYQKRQNLEIDKQLWQQLEWELPQETDLKS